MIIYEKRLPDDSHEISCLICYFRTFFFHSTFPQPSLDLMSGIPKLVLKTDRQAAVTKVMSTCPQLTFDLMSGIPKLFLKTDRQAAVTKVMSTCRRLILDLMTGIAKHFSWQSHVYLSTVNFRSDVRNPKTF